MSATKPNSDCICQQKHLDIFTATLKTDEFAPKAMRGSLLLMQYGANAKVGDIVSIHKPNTPNFTLVNYAHGVKYFAKAVVVGGQVEDNAQCSMHWFPSYSIDGLYSRRL